MNIIQKPSPNFKAGRSGYKPEIIVLHIMDDKVNASISETDSWFTTAKSGVSAHYGISSVGEVHQYVKDEDTAWANGIQNSPNFKLSKGGSINPNLYTISIEHEGKDLANATQEELNTSAELIKLLSAKWGIPIDRDHIIGHYQIDKTRKPNCPAVDKTVIDNIVTLAQGSMPQVTDKEKIKQAIIILQSLV